MKHAKLITTTSIVYVLILFVSCTKQDVNRPTAGNSISNSSAMATEMVLTPRGFMPKDRVHFVESNYSLNIVGNKIQKIENTTGRVVQEFEETPAHNTITNEALASGWITYAEWTNTANKPINYFSTTWKVPSRPGTNSGQTLFLFNGMQDGFDFSAHILQPVLQWGPSAAGGGPYWAITNWYVSSSNAFYGSLVRVSTGTILQGIMQTTRRNGSKFNYNSSFKGYPVASSLQVNNARQLFWAAETLESYGVIKNSNYPPDTKIKMDNIQILVGSTNAGLDWEAVNLMQTPQHTKIISNNSPGGEVDIFWH
ncbi:MAG TPA: hypothetical protein VH396_18885 [Chitinophagaceae bacterium]|jgi:hypothetical protein